jgi:CRP-like cAMP-binding protein
MKLSGKRTKSPAEKNPATNARLPTNNRLLKAMSQTDLALITPYLSAAALPRRKDLERPGIPFDTVYFLDHGVASVVALSDRDTQVEVGLIGCEGVSGLAVILASDRSPNHTYMQIAGSGLALSTTSLLTARDKSASLTQLLLRYAQAFAIQTTHTAVANAKAKIGSRLARWILMAYDRVPNNAIALTHDFLAIMLGVRRPGVTDALNILVRQGLIESPKNGLILLIDRDGLRKVAGKYYGVPEREYKRLIA